MTKENTLRELIFLSGLTQKGFAEKHGKKPNQISEWKTTKRHISNATLESIAKIEGYKLNINFELERL